MLHMDSEIQFQESDIKDHVKMADLVARGMEVTNVLRLSEKLAISKERLAEILSISKTTLHRRSERHELLKPAESERVLRFFRLYEKALEVFENRDRAVKWLSSSPKALGGKTPLEFAKTEPGARLVEDILGRIEEGVFS
jgi:putative toxin-antitoxin system antitoxin component (TIGR02293 family)